MTTKYERLKQARIAAKLTRSQLAAKLHTSEATYREWERNREPRSLETAQRMCETLGITLEYYITGRNHHASLSIDERQLIDLYRSAPAEIKRDQAASGCNPSSNDHRP
jgi:transcriptional regulator with XRE-family HTH domain